MRIGYTDDARTLGWNYNKKQSANIRFVLTAMASLSACSAVPDPFPVAEMPPINLAMSGQSLLSRNVPEGRQKLLRLPNERWVRRRLVHCEQSI